MSDIANCESKLIPLVTDADCDDDDDDDDWKVSVIA